MFSILAVAIYVPTHSVGCFPFSIPSPASIVFNFFFMMIIMTGLRQYFILVLIHISLIIRSVLSCACYRLYVFLGKMPIQVFCLFFFN